MRDILISSAVFVACLLVAMVSQVVAPSRVVAAAPMSAVPAVAVPSRQSVPAPMELDPDDPNPTLFAMASDRSSQTTGEAGDRPSITGEGQVAQAGAEAFGGDIVVPRERRTTSGLRITDLVTGQGSEATPGQTVVVHYRGTLENGKEFDSSYGRGPFSFPLGGGRVIPGWDEGVAGMMVGGKRKLVIPPELAYGSKGAGGVIPPHATLIFEVELLEVK